MKFNKPYFLNEWERDYYEERAAILQYDGHLSKEESEVRAMEEMLKKRKERHEYSGVA